MHQSKTICYGQSMEKHQTSQLAALKHALGDILLARLEPLSEFELIKQLQRAPYGVFDETALQGNLNLFQTHFLVFHCLYLLRAEWLQLELGYLRIEPLAIALEPLPAEHTGNEDTRLGLTQRDPLQDYYLDLSQLEGTTAGDVDALIGNFWCQMEASVRAVSADERSQALMVMQLSAMPGSEKQLKREFRQRVHKVHPDKGGSAEAMQDLQWAYHVIHSALIAGVYSN